RPALAHAADRRDRRAARDPPSPSRLGAGDEALGDLHRGRPRDDRAHAGPRQLPRDGPADRREDGAAQLPGGSARLGVLPFGDSITNGGGELQWGVALQSWALWVARGLGLPFTTYAVDGARVADVVGAQIPAFLARNAVADARYDLGCLYIGVNDVRAPDFD